MKRHILLASVLVFTLVCTLAGPAYADDGSVYVVRRGDTLLGIAARYGLTATQLAAANGLRWNAWVYVGQRLQIPGGVSAPPTGETAAPGGTYVVRPGDTLISISARHGITVPQLAAANGLRTNAWVYVDQRLRIPGQSAAPAPAQPAPAPAPSTGGTYVVRAGDTLINIALRHNVTLADLARANGMHTRSWVYVGQRLKIPGQSAASSSGSAAPAPAPAPAPAGGTYVVRPGDTLIRIATLHGVSISRLAAANGLHTTSWVYVGQRLQIPGATSGVSPSTPPSDPPPSSAGAGKWIDVNLSTQTLTAYEGNTAVYQTPVSSGTWRTPTVVGTFRVYAKYTSTRMSGPGYDMPNVPYVMYFYRGYSLHGTYWHSNFGTPMSHGCVNLPTPAAEWLYNWAPMGIKVVTHE